MFPPSMRRSTNRARPLWSFIWGRYCARTAFWSGCRRAASPLKGRLSSFFGHGQGVAMAANSQRVSLGARDMADDILVGKGKVSDTLLLRLSNRHGLVAGATGTGKTVTLQVMAEGFSRAGVPVF